jgi:hypothetical protein
MATKFITIRIPIPYIRLNRSIEKESLYVTSEDFAVRILDIKTRIASLKSRLGWTEKSNKSTQTQSEPVVASTPTVQRQDPIRAQKEAELADLKAKLLGRK